MPVRWAIYPPGTSGSVMLATELGIWYTLDIGNDPVEWVHAEQFPNVRVDMLSARESDGHILAATHGRGLFLSSGASVLDIRTSASPEGHIHIYPNPASEFVSIEISEGTKGLWTLEIYDLNGKLMKKEQRRTGQEGNVFHMSLDGLAPGSYLIRANMKATHYSQTIIKK